jgi:hypothetical protein
MRHISMLIVMTAMVFVAAGSARGITSPWPLLLDSAAVAASVLSSSPAAKGDESVNKTILPAAQKSTAAQLFVVTTAEDGKEVDEKNPPPRSTHCPPDKDDHQDRVQKGGDNQDKDNKDKDNKDKDHHDNCGKGNDGKNP